MRALVQDLCMRISCARSLCQESASGSCMTTCARFLYAYLLCKISLPGCLQQHPLGPLVQDRCMRISCARFLCEDLLNKTTCAGSLYADLLCKISLSWCLHQDPVGPLVQDLSMRVASARSLCQDVCIRIL